MPDTGSCKPAPHYIPLGDRHRLEVTVDPDGGQRYVPQAWIVNNGPEFGYWQSLLPEGESRQMLMDARNDCALHAGLKTV